MTVWTHDVDRRDGDRRQSERRVTGDRRLNSVRHSSEDVMFRSGRRMGEDRRKFDRRAG